MKNNFLFYPDPDSIPFFISVFTAHSLAAAYSINFCRERVGNFHVRCVAIHAD